ncbi:AfsR/SARP family transcriptional regulator [Rhizohabitans arisaemae]|uniref:AfsR/SARP family transcriptional regulator n=1 Tax=Rhizohabitans arisaemae TaxID=2720610 RepID=UPI0024B16495|nr:tetratricopeptide repeat protein [Rhizohabitans arisaemae]
MNFRFVSGVGLGLYVAERKHHLGTPREQCVLAILLLARGRPVTIDKIIELIWDNRPPLKARETLHTYISRLRSRLGAAVGERIRIPPCDGGSYVLEIDQEAVDLFRFESLKQQAYAVADTGDLNLAVERLRQAEELLSGKPLAGLPGTWAAGVGERYLAELHEVRLKYIEFELELGRHVQVMGELDEMHRQQPADETVATHLMTALYRCGRRSDALGLYRRVSRTLRVSEGISPGPLISELYERILRQDADLAVTPAYRGQEGTSQPDTQIKDVREFTGRANEVDVIAGLSGTMDSPGSTVLIHGMPGVGKTALAVHVAHRLAMRYPDANLYLDMRSHDPQAPRLEPATALSMLLGMLNVRSSRIPATLEGRSALWKAEITHRRMLVVLDDVADMEQIRPILTRSTASLILITSRVRLDAEATDGLTYLPLDGLPTADAGDLCARLTGWHRTSRAVGRVVEVSSGLPLLIRLLAPHIGSITESTRLGGIGENELPAEVMKVLSTAVEFSYRDLTVVQQQVVRLLSLCPGRVFSVKMASVLINRDIGPTRDLLVTIGKHHLLQEIGPESYRFHDVIYEYLHRRVLREESLSVQRSSMRRLIDHYLRVVDGADGALYPQRGRPPVHSAKPISSEAAKRWLDEEWRNVLEIARYAADHERHSECVELVHAIAEYLDTEGHWGDAEAGHRLAVRCAEELGDRRAQAQALVDLGFIRYRLGNHDAALRDNRHALSIYRALKDRAGEALVLDRVGIVKWASGNFREALAYYEDALAIHRELSNRLGEADTLGHSALAYWNLGLYQESWQLIEMVLEIHREIGNIRGYAKALNNAGDMQRHRGYHRHAMRLYEESLEIFKKIPGRQNIAIINNNVGNICQYKGRHEEALSAYRMARAEYVHLGDRRNQADVLHSIGTTYLDMGYKREALVHFQQALRLAEEIGDRYEKILALIGVADVDRALGRLESALGGYEEALSLARGIGGRYEEAQIHERMADAITQREGREAARISLRQAHVLFRELGLKRAEEIDIRLQSLEDSIPQRLPNLDNRHISSDL